MADISDVNASVIKDLYQRLESLSCASSQMFCGPADNSSSSDHDTGFILIMQPSHGLILLEGMARNQDLWESWPPSGQRQAFKDII